MKLNMKEIVKLSLILMLISLVASLALAFTNAATIDKIAEQKQLKNDLARKAVLPQATAFEPLEPSKLAEIISENPMIQDIHIGTDGSNTLGYVVSTLPSGYSGGVEVIVGVAMDGKLSGVRVGKHNETPGLGAKAVLPAFYTQYDGKMAAGVKVNKNQSSDTEIQAIAGATITSRAVTVGVNAAGAIVQALAGN